MHLGIIRRGWSDSGGAEAYLLRLSGALAGAGHTLTLYGSGSHPARWPYGWVGLDGSSPAAFARDWGQRPKEWDISLSLERVPGCDIFRAGDGVHAAWLERRARRAPWWRKISWKWNPKHRQILDLERTLCAPPSPTRIIANSHLVAGELKRYYGVAAERLVVIPNGFDPPARLDPAEYRATRSRLRTEWGILPGESVALFAGSGWERKGLRPAIQAAENLSSLRIVVAGKGPAHCYSSPSVLHLGPVPDLGKLFPGADFLLHPTLYDPFSNACLEALAGGLPVLTTRDNGFSELIEEGRTGSVLPENWTLPDLRQALDFWKNHAGASLSETARENLGQSCREAARPWSVARNLSATLALLGG